ncbi:hypothetical protein AX16_009861 [Volvariella volvacea WC 439]|nr:hypothetical protein AX16_009861 [Volvariella volvacea WC 439]
MESPQAYTQPFDTFDVRPLAKPTRKLLDRLVSWSQMKNYSSSESEPIVSKILERITVYIQAVESSILAALMGYRLSTDAMLLCNLVREETPTSAQEPFDALTQELYQSLITLAEDGHSHAEKAKTAFLNVEQDLFKIAADTKDNELLVQVPINNEKQVFKSLKTVGNDLVAGAKLMTEFYDLLENLMLWWALLKREISSENTSSEVLPPVATDEEGKKQESSPASIEAQCQTLLEKWGRLQKDHLAYYNMTDDIIAQYATLLPTASAGWTAAISPHTSSPTPSAPARLASSPSSSPSSTASQRSARLRALLSKLKNSLLFGHGSTRGEKLKEVTRQALKALSANSDPNKAAGNGAVEKGKRAEEKAGKGRDKTKGKSKNLKSPGKENAQH